MGRSYSLNGFLNAAMLRSNRTVLVEGPSDKHAMHKIELERFPSKAGASTIDHAGILDDPVLAGLGNKLKVQAVGARADELAQHRPRIANMLATLTDREWDGIAFVSHMPSPAWGPPSQQKNRFVTTGHSIENYSFDCECVTEFLKYAFPEYVTAELLVEIKSKFCAMLVFATVVSLKIRDDACIGRANGMVSLSHIEMKNDRFYLDSSFGEACALRDIPSHGSIVVEANLAIDAAWADLHDQMFTQWLPHGHIGEELLWSGVGKVAHAQGISLEVVKEIAHGHKKERERFKTQWLSKAAQQKRTPLDEVVEWLHT